MLPILALAHASTLAQAVGTGQAQLTPLGVMTGLVLGYLLSTLIPLTIERRISLKERPHSSAAQPSIHGSELRDDTSSCIQTSQSLERITLYLRQGQRSYLSQTGDLQGTAELSLLAQHTIHSLSLALFLGDDKKVGAMANNIFSMASKLDGVPPFLTAARELKALLSTKAIVTEGLPLAQTSHEDARLFQSILRHLKRQVKLDLTPYIYDVDASGAVYRAG